MATSKDVAARAGVSHTTVSRAFRGDVKLKPSTYEKVMTAAKELNYTPNSLASDLKRRHTKTVGFIPSDISNPYFMLIAQKLEDILNDEGYRLIVSFDACNFYKQQNAIKTMISLQAEVIIFSPIKGNCPCEYISHPDVKFIQLFNGLYDSVPTIGFDNAYGAYEGTSYLLKKGHRNILIIAQEDRCKGCVDAFAEYDKIPFFFCDCYPSDEKMVQAIVEYIRIHRPTAVFTMGNRYSKLAYTAFKQLGITFPDDISFLVFDDYDWTKILDISVISYSLDELTQAIADEVFALIHNHKNITHKSFKPHLIKRSSVRNINKYI